MLRGTRRNFFRARISLSLCQSNESKVKKPFADVLTDEYVSKTYPDVRQAATCDVVGYAVRSLCASHIHKIKRYAYGRQPFHILAMSASATDAEIVKKYFGNIRTFCETLPHLFQINKDKTAARLRMIRADIHLSDAEITQAIRNFVPTKGFMRLDVLSLIMQRREMEIYQILSENDDLAEEFCLKKDREVKEACWYVFRESWRKETEGLFKPGAGNKYFVTAVALGKKILQLAPPFWVPWNDLTHRFQRSILEKTTSYRSALIVTPELDQAYAFDGTLFVRRESHIQTELDPPIETFEDYNISPERVLKIAFALPCEAKHLRDVEADFKRWFPEVHNWINTVSAYTIRDLCTMYPAVIEIDKNDNARSLVKGEFPMFTQPIEEKLMDGNTEKAFIETLNSEEMKDVRAELLSRVSEPSAEVFRPVNFSMQQKRGKKVWVGRQAQIIPFSAPTMTDEEIVKLFEGELPEFGSMLLDDAMKSIRKKTPKLKYEMFRNAIHLRHDSSMLRFLNRNKDKIFSEQERLTGAHYEWAISRNDGTKESDHNPYVEESAIIQTLQDTWWKDQSEVKSRIGLWMQIPHLARKTIKRQGGLVKFLQAHSHRFLLDEKNNTVSLTRATD